MATDGAEFKRRVKYYGRTYTEIKNGSNLAIISDYSVAGLARELNGEKPLKGFRELVVTTVDCLQGLLAGDRLSLLQDLTSRLSLIAPIAERSESQRIATESLIREAGELGDLGNAIDSPMVTNRLLAACGRDLHEALVIGFADQYAMQHLNLAPTDLPVFLNDWQQQASPRLNKVMHSIYEDGRPAKEFLQVRSDLAPIKSDSIADLTSINIG